MSNREKETEITIKIPKSKLSKVKAFLKEEKVKTIAQRIVQKSGPKRKEQVTPPLPDGFIKGKYKRGDKPSDFGGIWEDDDRTAENIRKAAWHGRGLNY